MSTDPTSRDNGCIEGDFSPLLPCIFFGQIGIRQREVRGHRRGHPHWAGRFVLGKEVGNGMSPLHGVFMPLASCRDGVLRTTLMQVAETLRTSPLREFDDGSQEFAPQRAELNRAIRDMLRENDCREFDIKPDRGFFSLMRPKITKALFKRLSSFDYITLVRDVEGQPTEILESKPFTWNSYGDFMEWIHGPRLSSSRWWSHCTCELLADRMGVWSCSRFSSSEATHSRFDLSQFLTVRSDVPLSDLSVRFIMDEHGWAELRLTMGEQVESIRLSNAFDPFPGLLSWMKMLAKGEIPARLEIDEEGSIKALSAYYVGHHRHVLFVVQDDLEDDVVLLGGIVDHSKLVEAFRRDFLRFFQDEYNPDHWEWDWQREGGEPVLKGLMLTDKWLATGRWSESGNEERQ